ncbi:MAG: DUF302 domain-containing protein [Spirochaetales bacterium]|nr:DUF302 domain-containing protein [Spirochaetales bacterium]MCF7939317.1 DUF302 domain-containing protein [Spirochaetales bacterium]
MEYYMNTKVNGDFDEVIERVKLELAQEGFGVLSDIDVESTLQQKLGVDFRKYRILGACNPSFSHKALQAEDKIGTLLPCNVIVQELESGSIEVAAVDPKTSMQGVSNTAIETIAGEINDRLQTVIDRLKVAFDH